MMANDVGQLRAMINNPCTSEVNTNKHNPSLPLKLGHLPFPIHALQLQGTEFYSHFCAYNISLLEVDVSVSLFKIRVV